MHTDTAKHGYEVDGFCIVKHPAQDLTHVDPGTFTLRDHASHARPALLVAELLGTDNLDTGALLAGVVDVGQAWTSQLAGMSVVLRAEAQTELDIGVGNTLLALAGHLDAVARYRIATRMAV